MKRISVLLLVVLAAALVWLPPQQTEAQLPITLVVDGQVVSPDVPPQIVNGRVMVPLRFVTETIGMEVSWNDTTRTVAVTQPVEPPKPLQEPEIYGSETFVRETREALNRLKDKHPAGYRLVCAAFRSVQEADFQSDTPIAGVFPYTPDICLFNVRLGSIPTDERAIYLCHEAVHSQLTETRLEDAISRDDEEAFAYLVTYRAAKILDNSSLARTVEGAVREHLFR